MSEPTPVRRWTAAAAACALLVLSPFAAQPAAGAAAGASNWWYDLYDVAQVQAEGWTGEGVKVAVIDTQINPDLPVFSGRNLTVADGAVCAGREPVNAEPAFGAIHGSTVTATIIGNGTGAGSISGIAPGADVTFYGWGQLGDESCVAAQHSDRLSGFGWAVQRAIDDGAQIVTTSVSGSMLDGDVEVIANAIAKGVIVVAATSNPSAAGEIVPLGDNSQAYLNGVVAATAVDRVGDLQVASDGQPYTFSATTVVAAGAGLPTIGVTDASWDESFSATGSSLAAPLVAGMLAVAAQRYPDATANQLLQSLVHTTGGEQHDLEYDGGAGYGYGAAWLTSLVATDPAQFADENPLMDKYPAPTAAQVTAAAERGSVYPPTAQTPDSFGEYDDPAAPEQDDGGVLGTVLVAVLIVLGVVVAGVVVTVVIVVTRKRRTPSGGTS